ncbi:hypothetical protein ACROYT_G020365 [Oculina patagonica]
MKTVAALFLLVAFAAYVSAEEMVFHKAVLDFLDERHDDRMADFLRSQGLPEDTLVVNDPQGPTQGPPGWIKPCIDNGKKCWQDAGHDACKRLACIDNFLKCVVLNHPTPLPTLSPLHKGCMALLYLCRHQSPSCAGELCCFVRIKQCLALKPASVS